jgi:hypothetical protein
VYSGLTLNQIDSSQKTDGDKQPGDFHPLKTAYKQAASSEVSLRNTDNELRQPANDIVSMANGLDNELQAYVDALKLFDPHTVKRRDSNAVAHLLAQAEESFDWLFESSEFKEWSSKDPTAVLWLVGRDRSENAQAVGRLMQRILDSNVRASVFHYFNPPALASRDRAFAGTEALGIAREIVRQIIADDPQRILHAMHQYPLSTITKQKPYMVNRQDWELRHLMNVLFYCLMAAPDSATFLLIDGLDISLRDTHRFLGQLNTLIQLEIKKQPEVVLKVFFASATRSFPQPLSEADKQLLSIPYIEKDKELQRKRYLVPQLTYHSLT